jgi:hypothetical protein
MDRLKDEHFTMKVTIRLFCKLPRAETASASKVWTRICRGHRGVCGWIVLARGLDEVSGLKTGD